jgi:hypothetical protein
VDADEETNSLYTRCGNKGTTHVSPTFDVTQGDAIFVPAEGENGALRGSVSSRIV